MVGRGKRIRHEDARHRLGGNLCHRRRAGARKHQIGRGKRVAHVVNVGHDLPAGGLLLGQRQRLDHRVVLVAACGVNDAHVRTRENLLLQRRHALVEVAGAQASTKHQKERLVLGNAQLSTAVSARGIHYGTANGVSRHADLGVRARASLEGLRGRGERDAERRRLLGAHLVGKAGHGVLLVQRVRHVVVGTPAHQGQLHVGAEAHGHVGLALRRKHLPHLALGRHHANERRDEGPRFGAVEARDLDHREGKARLRHQRGLKTGRLTKELHLMAACRELLGKRERRVDVSRGSARGNGYLELGRHGRAPFSLTFREKTSGGLRRWGQGRCACGR